MDLKAQLHLSLQANRAAVRRSAEGLGEYDLRRPMTPTGTNLLGLTKHLAIMEYLYLGESFGRPAGERIGCVDDGSIWQGADMWAQPEESSQSIKDLYRRACDHSDQTVAALTLETPGEVAHWPRERQRTTLGVLLLRVVDETAHHAGHADIVRELLDGRGGVDQDEFGDQEAWREFVATIQGAADTFRSA